jgi:aminopeptidase-like protein/aminoglycoside N3'-acetyltransferase
MPSQPCNSQVSGANQLSYEALVQALREAGLQLGGVVFFQVAPILLTSNTEVKSESRAYELLYLAMREVLGAAGTILVPTFSLSFLKDQDFNPATSPSVPGNWSSWLEFLEYFRGLPNVVRSSDPLYSVSGSGPLAHDLLTNLPASSFGNDCFYARLMDRGGMLCSIGGSLGHAPFITFVEETVGVPFRYKKLFTGKIWENGRPKKQAWISTVPIQADNALPDVTRIETIATKEGLCKVVAVGPLEVSSIGSKDLWSLLCREIARDPWITAKGPSGDPIELEKRRHPLTALPVQLAQNASLQDLVLGLWKLPRDIVSDGYDVALRALAAQVPMTIHEYPSGTECWTWIVPEKWTCHEAWLETLDGRRLFSYADNPLHVVSYSLPIGREVSREELFEHLHVHPGLPDAIPFVFKYYERDWGLCCSRQLKESLRDDHYRVMIRSEFGYGTLKVGEIVAPGMSQETFILCAHLCHPGMVNDDLSGVVVGLKVMEDLLQRKNLRYTYRFLIVPETIGSLAYLSHNEALIPRMAGGIFLEMLGLDNPHALQLSFDGDTGIDRSLTRALKEFDSESWTGPFRTVVGNDERQFNAPGVRVPMLSVSRVIKDNVGCWRYYPQYHSSQDTPENTSFPRLAESKELVLKMIDTLEALEVPINRHRGEIFCSRYGLHIDAYTNPESNKALFDILFLIDGKKSLAEIASICSISLQATRRVVEQLCQLDLVECPGLPVRKRGIS